MGVSGGTDGQGSGTHRDAGARMRTRTRWWDGMALTKTVATVTAGMATGMALMGTAMMEMGGSLNGSSHNGDSLELPRRQRDRRGGGDAARTLHQQEGTVTFARRA